GIGGPNARGSQHGPDQLRGQRVVVDGENGDPLPQLRPCQAEALEGLQHLLPTHGLDQIVGCPQSKTFTLLLDNRHDDDRDISSRRFSLQADEQVPAIDLRQQQVEGDEAWLELPGFSESLLTVPRYLDAIPGPCQRETEELSRWRIVLHH